MKNKQLLIFASCLIAVTALAYTTQQASSGKKLFAEHCAVCHGNNGQGATVPQKYGPFGGMETPKLIGSGSLPGYHNAGHVYSFIKSSMPLNEPGSLTEKEYLDITAYIVDANGYAKPDNTAMTPQSASKIQLKK